MASRPRFLLTFLAWAGGLSGGDRHLLEVAARWRDHVDVSVLAPPQAEPLVRSFLGDVEVHALGSSSGRRARQGPLLAFEYVRRAVTASVRRLPRTDVVVAASHFAPDAAALRAEVRRGALGVGYVYHLVAGRERRDLRTLWSTFDERVGLAVLRQSANVVFVPNAETVHELVERGFEPVRTAVGIDLAAFQQARLTSEPRAAFVARLVRSKGVQDAVRAWAEVRRGVPGAKLVVAGDGPEREAGTELARQLGIADAVEWRGFVGDDDEKRRLLSESRLLLAPSYEEGWGISVCEALATGIPVVAYRLSALDELFDSAYLGAKPGDTAELARLATHVLTDDEAAGELAARGRTAAARYDVARVAESELEVILARLET